MREARGTYLMELCRDQCKEEFESDKWKVRQCFFNKCAPLGRDRRAISDTMIDAAPIIAEREARYSIEDCINYCKETYGVRNRNFEQCTVLRCMPIKRMLVDTPEAGKIPYDKLPIVQAAEKVPIVPVGAV